MCRACGGTKKFPLFSSLIDCPYCVTGEAVLGKPHASLADVFFTEPEKKTTDPVKNDDKSIDIFNDDLF